MISDKDKGESGYKMEELLHIVAGLARKYTSGESSSVTYEKAEQLMGAVVYCINEAINQEEYAVAPTKKQDAEEVYNMGYKAVTDKVKRSVEIYNQVIKQIKNRYAFICKVYRLEMLNMLIYIHDEGVNSRSCWRLF